MQRSQLFGCAALAVALCVSMFAAAASAATVNYTINPSLSSLTVTGTIKLGAAAASPLVSQFGGTTNVTNYSGTIKADRVGSSIQFLSGSSIDAALQSVSVTPDENGFYTTAADGDYGLQGPLPPQTEPLHVEDTTTGYIGLHKIVLGATSAPLTITGTSFPANSIAGAFTTGKVAYARVGDLFENIYGSGLLSMIGSSATNSPAGSASIVNVASVETITIPVNLSYSFTFPGNATFPDSLVLNYTLSGTLVASATVPEPACATLVGLLGASIPLRRRRLCA